MRALASKADALMALHVPHQHEVAAVAPQDSHNGTVAAAARGGGKKSAPQKKKKYRRHCSQSPNEERQSPCAGCISVLGTRHATASSPARGQRRRRLRKTK
jgi:hypothetical protein